MESSCGRILLVITGGIAAYKTPELVRLLVKRGFEVRTVMTPGAAAFVTPLTLQAVSGTSPRTTLFDPDAEAAMGHIELARWADRIVVAPATADFIARLAAGMADDLAAAVCLCADVPIAIAPAMNRVMWQNPATQANCSTLVERGCSIWGPAEGDQACGETGPGRMLEPADLAALIDRRGGALDGLRIMVTAGPTREAIDPVRYLTNRSSGKMGFAVAAAAVTAGAAVTLVSGPTAQQAPAAVALVPVQSAAEMLDAVTARVSECDIFIAAAAVADYSLEKPAPQKQKKGAGEWSLTLQPTVDILRTVAARPGGPFTVGFAAETRNTVEYARDKLAAKGLDMIVANDVSQPGVGFDSDDNELVVIWAGGERHLERASKQRLAHTLIELVAERYEARQAG